MAYVLRRLFTPTRSPKGSLCSPAQVLRDAAGYRVITWYVVHYAATLYCSLQLVRTVL